MYKDTRWAKDIIALQEDGKWDMSHAVNDKIYFPLSDNWRKKETRQADCTKRISNLIDALTL